MGTFQGGAELPNEARSGDGKSSMCRSGVPGRYLPSTVSISLKFTCNRGNPCFIGSHFSEYGVSGGEPKPHLTESTNGGGF